jgi:hypothetical protein
MRPTASAADWKPQCAAAVTTCAFQAAADATRRLGGNFTTLSETVDQAFAILENGLNAPVHPEE